MRYDQIVDAAAPPDDEFLTISEAAELLRIGLSTAKREARAGRFPGAIKIGRQWRVSRGALMDSINGTPQ